MLFIFLVILKYSQLLADSHLFGHLCNVMEAVLKCACASMVMICALVYELIFMPYSKETIFEVFYELR
jgi:hypothetical protein